MYAIRERINSLFFGTLLLEEQLKLNTLYDEELARNYQKVQSFIANGVANAADLDAVKVEQLSNRQRRAELEATCKAYRQMLGAFTGTDLAHTELIQPIARTNSRFQKSGAPNCICSTRRTACSTHRPKPSPRKICPA